MEKAEELIFEAFAALPTWMGFISHTLIIDLHVGSPRSIVEAA